jgi:hypothetical protein
MPQPAASAAAVSWVDFLAQRPRWLRSLAQPILACSARTDTAHPVFHGCIDWHSSVHSLYALHVLFRLTGDKSYLERADRLLRGDGLSKELEDMRSGSLREELPYGFSWFLALAIEHESTTDRKDLRPLAREAARQLSLWLGSLSAAEVAAGFMSDEYGNLSWATLNLYRWARYAGNSALAAQVRTFVSAWLKSGRWRSACGGEAVDREVTGFFPPCLFQAMVVAQVAPGRAALQFAHTVVPAAHRISPLRVQEINGHSAGLDFSRAWALWSLYHETKDRRYRLMFQQHVATLIGLPQYWAKTYAVYAHWVAQFGVYALAETY